MSELNCKLEFGKDLSNQKEDLKTDTNTKTLKKGRVWTDSEDEYLKINYGEIPTKDIVKNLNITKRDLETRVRKLGLKMTEEQKARIKGSRVWSDEEDNYLRNNYGEMTKDEIAKNLNIDKGLVVKRIEKLGLKMTEEQRANLTGVKIWSDEEDAIIIKYYSTLTSTEIAKKLKNIPDWAVRRRAKFLGLSAKDRPKKSDKISENAKPKIEKYEWDSEKDTYLTNNYGEITIKAIAENLGTTYSIVCKRITKLGLKMTEEQKERLTGKRKWVDKEDKKLERYYGKVDISVLSKKLKRTETAIRKRAVHLGLCDKRTKWTDESMEYIEAKWGIIAVETLAKRFDLTPTQVRNIARFLDLGEERKANNNVFTVKDVAEITGQTVHQVNNAIRWGHLPFRYFRVRSKKYIQVTYDNLCKYLRDEEHCNLANADIDMIKPYFCDGFENTNRTIHIYTNDKEIEKIKERIRKDKEKLESRPENFGKDWTIKEKNEIIELLKTKKYTHRQICEMYKRPIGGVRAKSRLAK